MASLTRDGLPDPGRRPDPAGLRAGQVPVIAISGTTTVAAATASVQTASASPWAARRAGRDGSASRRTRPATTPPVAGSQEAGTAAGTGLTPTALPGVSVLRATAPTEPLGEVAEPALAVIAQGVKETAVAGRAFTYGPGQFLIVPVELPVVGHIAQASPAEPLLAFVLSLRPEKIAALLAETAPVTTAVGVRAARTHDSPARIGVSDASPALIDAISRLLALLGSPGDAAVLAPGVEDLAALATMSVTSFHRHFRALTAMTPIQYQKQIRLHEARARLLARPGDVAGTGFAVGYGSPSQFSREYRRMFGAPPSRAALAPRR
ncbi:MAG TPA: AraC family transcriptional regulator [Streptosporangiaceae bacterium]|jgi:AraC-like DNA-binding protein